MLDTIFASISVAVISHWFPIQVYCFHFSHLSKVLAAEMVESNVSTISETFLSELVSNLSSHQELNVIPETLTPQCNCSLRIEGG